MRKYFKAYVKSQHRRRGAAAAVLQRAVRTRKQKPETLHIQGRDTHKAEKRLGSDRRRQTLNPKPETVEASGAQRARARLSLSLGFPV